MAVSLDQTDTQLNYTEQPSTIRISIEGLSFNASSDVQLHARETKLIDFYPSKLVHGEYKIIAEGIKGLIFRNESRLLIDSEAGPNIYIQTDKAIYKPLDLIQFRIVILDEHTRPLKLSEPIRVYIAVSKNILVVLRIIQPFFLFLSRIVKAIVLNSSKILRLLKVFIPVDFNYLSALI